MSFKKTLFCLYMSQSRIWSKSWKSLIWKHLNRQVQWIHYYLYPNRAFVCIFAKKWAIAAQSDVQKNKFSSSEQLSTITSSLYAKFVLFKRPASILKSLWRIIGSIYKISQLCTLLIQISILEMKLIAKCRSEPAAMYIMATAENVKKSKEMCHLPWGNGTSK